jgi:hypothetical protein
MESSEKIALFLKRIPFKDAEPVQDNPPGQQKLAAQRIMLVTGRTLDLTISHPDKTSHL